MTPVKPLRSIVSWVGGKRRLAPAIVTRISALPHTLYAEVFVGMGSVFLARTAKPKAEVINDRSGDVVNLFRVAKHHPQALVDDLRLALSSREEFHRLLATPPEVLTDVQRAARFFYLQRLRYGGKPTSNSFPARGNAAKGINVARLQETLMAIQARLSTTVIENLDWPDLLARYDRDTALFYLDPPYYGCEDYYGPGLFSRADHAKLAEALLRLKGQWLLSINDTPEIRRLYQGRAQIEEVTTKYTLAGGRAKPITELLIQKE